MSTHKSIGINLTLITPIAPASIHSSPPVCLPSPWWSLLISVPRFRSKTSSKTCAKGVLLQAVEPCGKPGIAARAGQSHRRRFIRRPAALAFGRRRAGRIETSGDEHRHRRSSSDVAQLTSHRPALLLAHTNLSNLHRGWANPATTFDEIGAGQAMFEPANKISASSINKWPSLLKADNYSGPAPCSARMCHSRRCGITRSTSRLNRTRSWSPTYWQHLRRSVTGSGFSAPESQSR